MQAEFFGGDGQRWRQAQAAVVEQKPIGDDAGFQTAVDYRFVKTEMPQVNRQHQTFARNAVDGRVLQQLEQQGMFGGHSGQQIAFAEYFHHGAGGRSTNRIAAKGGDVPQYGLALESAHDFGRCRKSPNRQAAAQTFGEGHDVGHDAKMLKTEHLAGAAHAGLYFVDDEQGAYFTATGAQGLHPGGARGLVAGFALHTFHNHRRRLRGDAFQFGSKVVGQYLHAGQQGPEGIFEMFVAHHTQSAMRAAVVGVAEGDQAGATGITFGQFEGAFHSFGAAVGEVHIVDARRQ